MTVSILSHLLVVAGCICFLTGLANNVSAGYVYGADWTYSPESDNTKHAIGFGVYTPQLGASPSYTPKWLVFNTNYK